MYCGRTPATKAMLTFVKFADISREVVVWVVRLLRPPTQVTTEYQRRPSVIPQRYCLLRFDSDKTGFPIRRRFLSNLRKICLKDHNKRYCMDDLLGPNRI